MINPDMSEAARLDSVYAALRTVVDPCSIATGHPIDLVDMGLVESVEISDASVTVVIWPTSPICMQLTLIRAAVEQKIKTMVPGVDHVHCRVEYGSEWHPERMAPHARTALRLLRP